MKIVIYGVGRLAEYAAYLIDNDTKNTVSAFCMKEEYLPDTKSINNLPVIEFEDLVTKYPPNEYQLFIAVGINKIRHDIFNEVKQKGYTMTSYISSKAIIWDNLVYGENVWVGEGSIIQPFVSIGDNSILFGANIGHHSTLESHTLLSGSTIGGNVTVGEYSVLGLNSSVQQNISIGAKNIIGMGCIIEKDTKYGEIYHTGKSTKKRAILSDKFDGKYLK